MTKFSIIIPVYNKEKYIKSCLESVVVQTINDYEVVIVNDGSTDKSEEIIKEYLKKYKNFKYINQVNQGLSIARNNGVKEAKGEYIIFLDSDDSIEPKLLENLKKETQDTPSIIRFQLKTVNDRNIEKYQEKGFKSQKGYEAFKKIVEYKYVELACLYCFNKNYFIENNFEFIPNRYHEDYGLIPYAIMCAPKVRSIDYIGYNYNIIPNSIMNTNDYKKTYKKVYDVIYIYEQVIEKIKLSSIEEENKKYCYSFLTNSMLQKIKELNKKDQNEILKKVKKMNVSNYLVDDTVFRKIKKLLLKINIKLYLKVIK